MRARQLLLTLVSSLMIVAPASLHAQQDKVMADLVRRFSIEPRIEPRTEPNLSDGELPQRQRTEPGEVVVRFAPTRAMIANPDGGLVGWAGDLAQLWPPELQAEVAVGLKLLRSHIDLSDFRQRRLSADFLARLDRGFVAIRQSGVKVIPRFSYNSPSTSWLGRLTARDAELDTVLMHLRQLKPVLAKHADIIGFFEAGFIGAWGEWHTSSNRLDQAEKKRRIRDALLAAVPAAIPVMFRYPADIRRWYPDLSSPTGSVVGNRHAARIGFHNDCFLSNYNDGSTYIEPGLKDYVERLANHGPTGGETCRLPGMRTDCESILREGPRFQLTWLNLYGALDRFVPVWQAGGCLRQVLTSIGPRMVVNQMRHPASAVRGESIQFSIDIENRGWGQSFVSRRVLVRLEHERTAAVIVVRAPAGGRVLPMPGAHQSIRLTATLPANTALGRYRVSISAIDDSAALAENAGYALRFAVRSRPELGQTHDKKTGFLQTGSWLTVRSLPGVR